MNSNKLVIKQLLQANSNYLYDLRIEEQLEICSGVRLCSTIDETTKLKSDIVFREVFDTFDINCYYVEERMANTKRVAKLRDVKCDELYSLLKKVIRRYT